VTEHDLPHPWHSKDKGHRVRIRCDTASSMNLGAHLIIPAYRAAAMAVGTSTPVRRAVDMASARAPHTLPCTPGPDFARSAQELFSSSPAACRRMDWYR
jgi:hypothetical protein